MSVSLNFLGGGGGGRGRHDDRRPRGNPPGPRTNYRLVVENLSSRTSWQVSDFMILIYFLQKPKVVTVVRAGSTRPHKKITILLNRRAVSSI